MSITQKPMDEQFEQPMDEQPMDWQQFAWRAWQAETVAEDEERLKAERAHAERVIQALAEFDPPILGATPLGDIAEVDGIRFTFSHAYGREDVVMIRACDRCGEDVQSTFLRNWSDIGHGLARGPADEIGRMLPRYKWGYHRCPEPDPLDLVPVLRHLLLFVYDRETGEPVLPLYAINRAEQALAAFEKEADHG